MAFPVNCPECDAEFSVGDVLIGKTIKCKSCGEQFKVPAPKAAAAAPIAKAVPKKAAVARDDDEDDYEDEAPRKKKAPAKAASKLPLILGGLAAAVVVVGGGGLAAYMLMGGSEKDPVAVNANPVPTAPRTVAGDAGAPRPTPPAATDAVKPEAPKPAPEPPKPAPPAPAPAPAAVAAATAPQPPLGGGGTSNDQMKYTLGVMDYLTTQQVKKASVLIKAETNSGAGTGSGWFGLEEGLVFTNAHVLFMKAPGSKEPKKLTLYLNAGTNEQREIPHQRVKILAVDREIDLALLQIVGEKDLPSPLKVKASSELFERQGLTTIGYPLGYTTAKLGGGSTKEPEVSVRPTTFVAFRRNDFGITRRVQLEGGCNPGNSGGPVVDGNGMVVAVIVELIGGGPGIALTLAVPTEYALGLLAGRIGEVEYGTPYRANGKVRVPVTATCFDPKNRLQKVGVAGWVGEVSDKYRAPGNARPAPQAGDSDLVVTTLKYDQTTKKATGELELPELPAGRAYWAQPYFANTISPEYHLPGRRIKMTGPPVDKTPAQLVAKFPFNAKRGLTLTASSNQEEAEEGEGNSSNERVTIQSTIKMDETVIQPAGGDSGQSARLKLDFTDVALKAGRGDATDDALPPQIRNVLKNSIKGAGAVGAVNARGELFKYQINTLNVQDPLAKFLIPFVSKEAMDAMLHLSIPMPNKSVNAGESWEAQKTTFLTFGYTRIGKTGKPEEATKSYKYLDTVKYTYIGQRQRQGKAEAVVEIVGKVTQAPGEKSNAAGESKGYALIEIDSGTVVLAEMESEITVDTSREGTRLRASEVNKYKLERGATSR